jgi:secondary thiamine-phosphate synthase enzyme
LKFLIKIQDFILNCKLKIIMQLTIRTSKQKEIIDITEKIQDEVRKNGMQHGVCMLFIKHTTAALTTADLDPGTDQDMLDAFEQMVPHLQYRHPHNPKHVPDHILSSLIGPSVAVPVENGVLELGIWQRIVLVELDGPKERKVSLQFLSTNS